MAANDDLDDFFKKKDRKGNKNKKQPALLTNNEELLKQLVIVTSATSAFKENMDFEEEDDEVVTAKRHPLANETNGVTNIVEDTHAVLNKSQAYPASGRNKSKATSKLSVQDNNNTFNEQQPGDEWEEFEDSKSKYEQLRLKFARGTNEDGENEEDYSDDENTHQRNFDGNTNDFDGADEEQSSRANRQREQQKDKPVWKLDQVQQQQQPATNEPNDLPAEKVEEPTSAGARSTINGAYQPPHLRNKSSVPVVSVATNQRVSKKDKPNLTSTEEFPTLGTTINKK